MIFSKIKEAFGQLCEWLSTGFLIIAAKFIRVSDIAKYGTFDGSFVKTRTKKYTFTIIYEDDSIDKYL